MVNKCHNPCFIRLCFAMCQYGSINQQQFSHNPCFIRLCFAMYKVIESKIRPKMSQSLFY